MQKSPRVTTCGPHLLQCYKYTRKRQLGKYVTITFRVAAANSDTLWYFCTPDDDQIKYCSINNTRQHQEVFSNSKFCSDLNDIPVLFLY